MIADIVMSVHYATVVSKSGTILFTQQMKCTEDERGNKMMEERSERVQTQEEGNEW